MKTLADLVAEMDEKVACCQPQANKPRSSVKMGEFDAYTEAAAMLRRFIEEQGE